MTAWYVRSARPVPDARRGFHLTGDVLHLAPPGHGVVVPLCTTDSWSWVLTGPKVPGWYRHSHFPLCSRCERALADLFRDADEQIDRHTDHLDRTTPAAQPREDDTA